MDLDQAYRWLCGDFEGRDEECLEQDEECTTMTGVKPVKIDDVVESLNELKSKHGNLEVRRFEFRYSQEPCPDAYPKFCTVPTDKGNTKIVVIL